jgi:hypothetical protein
MALEFYAKSGSADALFRLDPERISISDQKSVESLDIPSLIWNDSFDSSYITARWSISGKFFGVDADWDNINFTGRPEDFIHNLRSLLKGINPVTGNYPFLSGSNTDALRMKIIKSYELEQYFDTITEYSSNVYYVVATDMNFTMNGGVPLMCEYSITLVEVSDIIRL